MRLKKTWITLGLILALSAIVSICVLAATSEKGSDTPTPKEAEAVKEYTENGVTKTLAYRETKENPGGARIFVYTDDDGAEYQFNESDMLVGYFIGERNVADEMSDANYLVEKGLLTVDEQKAAAIAEKACREKFGDKFDLVTFGGVTKDQGDGTCYVRYYQYLGEEKNIIGLRCTVMILANGTVFDCSMYGYDELVDFDASRLDGITEEVLSAFVKEQAKEQFGRQYYGCCLYQSEPIRLLAEDGRYYLRVYASVDVIPQNGTTPYPSLYAYEYDLPQA